jgi:DME family drug/metabolite transporter
VLLLGSPAAGAHRVAGTGLALLAAAGFAVLSLDRRDALPGLDRVAATGLGFLAGSVLLLPAAQASGMGFPVRPDTIGAVLFLGLVPTAIAYTSYFAGLHHAGPSAEITDVLLEPLTATLLAKLLNQEHLDGLQILGALLVLAVTGIHQTPTT